MIKAIIWDIGGVLWRLQDLSAHQRWEAQLGLTDGELGHLIFGSPIALQASIGKATPAEVWEWVANQLHLSAEELNKLQVDVWNGGVWDEELLAYIYQLKTSYKTGIISDAWLDARESVREWINESLFDVILFSAEEGIKKPHPLIYERMLEQLEISAEEAIFIDDWAESVEGANALGILGIQYSVGADIQGEIEKLIAQMGQYAG